MTDADMQFSVGSSVTFGFDVGGSYVPPEPSGGGATVYGIVNQITGVTGALANSAIYGTAEREEET